MSADSLSADPGRAATTTSVAVPDAIEHVGEKFFSLRRRYALTRVTCAVATLLIVALLFWVAVAAVDFVFELSVATRKFLAVGFAVVAATWIILRGRVLLRELNVRHFAGKLESHFPDFGQRLRTILDSLDGRVHGPTEMLSALGNQTLGRWETSSPSQILPVRWAAAAIGGVLLVAAAIGLLNTQDEWSTALRRSLGQDAPYTQVLVASDDFRVIEGDSIMVKMTLTGRTNRDVMVRYRESGQSEERVTANSEDWNEIHLLPVENSPKEVSESGSEDGVHFATSLGRAKRDLEYQFVTSAGRSRIYDVTVQPLVVVLEHSVTVTSPAYTGLQPRTFEDKKEVGVLAASETLYEIRTSHPLSESRLLVGAKKNELQSVDLLSKTEDPAVWQFSLPTEQSVFWRFEGESADGVPLDPIGGRLRVRRDGSPKIKWRGPKSEINVHTLTEVPMEVDISDDFGITECGIAFQLGDEEEFILTEWASASVGDRGGASEMKRRHRLAEILPLESFGLSQFDFVSYYAYAVDNREGSLQRTESDIRYIDIRPLRQFYSQDELGPNADGGDGFVTSLAEVIRRQRVLINRTRRLVRESSFSANVSKQLGTLDSLVQTQSELAGFVDLIIRRLTERGFDDNLDALFRAESSMLQAADSLAVAEFPLAQSQQQDAMRALVEAKDDLRQLLVTNQSSASQAALRQIAQELRQRLRLEPDVSDLQLASRLYRIARNQRALGREALSIEAARQKLDDSPTNRDIAGGETLQSSASEREVSEGGEQDETPAMSAEQRLDSRHSAAMDKQVELADELRGVADELSETILESELVASRMTTAIEDMNQMPSLLSTGSPSQFDASSVRLASDLEELALLIESLSQLEPVDRVAALRDLAEQLAEAEREQLEQMEQRSGSQGAAQSPSGSGGPQQENEEQSESEMADQARRISARAETTEEVLRSLSRLTDEEAGEILDQVNKFLEESQFLETLAESRSMSAEQEESSQQDGGQTASANEDAEQARERVADYRDASEQLETIYRRLIAPQLERLRDLELEAEQIRQQMENGSQPNMDESLELRNLAQQLSEAGFSDLAAVLGGEGKGVEGSAGEQLHFVVNAIRARIQEMIRRETSVDRDVPIPDQFRDLVDRYFRVLAGEQLESDEISTN